MVYNDALMAKSRLTPKTWEALLGRIDKVAGQYRVCEDRSPVMQSRGSYAAKLDRASKVIELNGYFLDRSRDRGRAKAFLIFHELAHAVLPPAHPESDDEAGALVRECGGDVERACDRIAWRALRSGREVSP